MDPVVQFILLTAAIVYIGDHLAKAIASARKDTIRKKLDTLAEIREEGLQAVNINFNLWWESDAKPSAKKAVYKHLLSQIPEGVPDGVKDEIVSFLPIDMMIDDIKEAALYLAVHAYIKPEETKLMAELSRHRSMRAQLQKNIEEREELLDHHATQLVGAGVDPDEIIERFSKE